MGTSKHFRETKGTSIPGTLLVPTSGLDLKWMTAQDLCEGRVNHKKKSMNNRQEFAPLENLSDANVGYDTKHSLATNRKCKHVP